MVRRRGGAGKSFPARALSGAIPGRVAEKLSRPDLNNMNI
jgi:hypothetical protein